MELEKVAGKEAKPALSEKEAMAVNFFNELRGVVVLFSSYFSTLMHS